MDRLWAPWRAQYIRDASSGVSSANPECFICQGLAEPEDRDRDNLIVWRRPRTVVILNRFPYNNGHLLVAPRCHKATLGELSRDELTEPVETIRSAMRVLDRLLRPHGYNVGLNQGRAAGAGLPGHLHWHIVPRWDGDTNFMPVLCHSKVIVESLAAFHDQFIHALATLSDEPAS